MTYKLTIIVPVFNEEDNLKRVETELSKYLEIAIVSTSVLFINDGSSDNSLVLIEAICQRNDAFSFISFKENKGLSAVLKAGFDYTNSEWVGYMDSDLQTIPEDFNILLEHKDCYDLVTGIRLNRKDTLVKTMASKIANYIRRAFTQDGTQDSGCPLKIIKTDYAKRIPMFRGLHRFLPAMIILQNGRVKQIPVRHFPRVAGSSKYRVSNRLPITLVDCFVYLWMKKRYINYDVDQTTNTTT